MDGSQALLAVAARRVGRRAALQELLLTRESRGGFLPSSEPFTGSSVEQEGRLVGVREPGTSISSLQTLERYLSGG